MSVVRKIISSYQESVSRRDKYMEERDKEIERLESEKYSCSHRACNSDDVLAALKKISDGLFTSKQYFDDADISWYLQKYGHCGPHYAELEKIYSEGIEKCAQSKGISLPMFSFEKECALNLINEVEDNYKYTKSGV